MRRPALLHRDRRGPGVERPGREERLDPARRELSGRVVDVGLEDRVRRGRAPASPFAGSVGVRRDRWEPSTARSTFGRSRRSAVPAPQPMRSGAIEGQRWEPVACAPTIAAPVGVTNSKSRPPSYVASPARHSTVAGAGSGSVPCAARDEAAPHRQRGDEHLGAQVVERRGAADDVGDGVDGARPRGSARRRSARGAPSPRPSRGAGTYDARARAPPPGGRPASSSARTLAYVRGGCRVSTCTSKEVATIPLRTRVPKCTWNPVTASAASASPITCAGTPRSTSAATIMSPARPLGASRNRTLPSPASRASAGDAARASRCPCA